VHGVRSDFLIVGASLAKLTDEERAATVSGDAYFLGKCLWTKGYQHLFDQFELDLAAGVPVASMPTIDTFGSGRDEDAIRTALETAPFAPLVRMHPGIDHCDVRLLAYRVFINPSESEVLCTATAEALAMGKKVLLPRHACNRFFEGFRNAIIYDDRAKMMPLLVQALKTPPEPLTAYEQYQLSWEAATDRLLDASRLDVGEGVPRQSPLHALSYAVHYAMGVPPLDDYFRANSGATPIYASWKDRVAAMVAETKSHE